MTHEPCTRSKLVQLRRFPRSREGLRMWSVRAFGYKVYDRDLEFCVAE